jgi:DNA polymerase I
VPIILAGDYTVVPTAQDIYPSKSWDEDALVQPASRAAFAELTKQGWADAVRTLYPTDPMYTFWHYLRSRWQRDAGLRIDHVLLSPAAADRLEAAGVDRGARGQPGASDHAPVWVELSDANGKRRLQRAGGKSSQAESKRRSRSTAAGSTRSGPLLVIDGDSFAHRAYHALPKTIRRKDGKGGGAIVGFANFLLRLYEAEQPRAVVVGWDTLDVPTERHEKFAAYQSGREFDDALVDQLEVLPELAAARGFKNAKAAGYEARDFLAAAVTAERRRRGEALVASAAQGDEIRYLVGVYPIPLTHLGWSDTCHFARSHWVKDSHGIGRELESVPVADPSDKLPGARGVGPKGAADLLKRYGTLSINRDYEPEGTVAFSGDTEAHLGC